MAERSQWWLPWRATNLTLFVVLAVVIATGVGAVATGSPRGAWVVVAHGVAGLVVVLLIPWKRRVAAGGLRRARAGRWASLALAVLVVAALVLGVVSSTGVLREIGGQEPLWWHIAAALVALPLLAWHVVLRPVRPRRTDVTRRALVRAGTLAAAGGALWVGTEAALRLTGLPGAGRRFTGSYVTDPEAIPVTSWIDDPVQRIRSAAWRLRVLDADGERELTAADVAELEQVSVRTVLDCTSGWYAEQEWGGVRVADLLRRVGPEHRSVRVRSITGYDRLLPLTSLDTLVLASRSGGEPLDAGHGFPARLVAPGRRGFWWVKWVTDVELSARPWWVQVPFPLT